MLNSHTLMYDMSLQPPLFEKLLLIESGNYNPGVYPIGHKLSGRLRPYPGKMPWMFEAWTNGLRLLNEIINEKKL